MVKPCGRQERGTRAMVGTAERRAVGSARGKARIDVLADGRIQIPLFECEAVERNHRLRCVRRTDGGSQKGSAALKAEAAPAAAVGACGGGLVAQCGSRQTTGPQGHQRTHVQGRPELVAHAREESPLHAQSRLRVMASAGRRPGAVPGHGGRHRLRIGAGAGLLSWCNCGESVN